MNADERRCYWSPLMGRAQARRPFGFAKGRPVPLACGLSGAEWRWQRRGVGTPAGGAADGAAEVPTQRFAAWFRD
jgi:hypothetical protein